MLKPEELALTFLSVGSGSDEVLATITIKVYPVTHMVEIVFLVLGDLDGFDGLCDVVRIHADDVNVTILLSWHKEAVWDLDGALTKDVIGYDLDVVGPLEAWGVKKGRLEITHIAIHNSVLNVTNDVDFARSIGAKA